MRPPPLKWNVTKAGGKFIIDWVPPEIYAESKWRFKINYTECNTSKVSYTTVFKSGLVMAVEGIVLLKKIVAILFIFFNKN